MSLTNNQITAQNFKDFLTALLPYLGGGSGGGHTIKDNTDTALTQRDVLQFAGDLEASDDDTNKKTVVTPHELTSAEMAEIMSTLPGTPTDLPVLFDERGTEYVVGYYVDSNGLKKPVYEKSFTGTTPSSANTSTDIFSISDLNIDELISINGNITEQGGTYKYPINYYIENGDYTACWLRPTTCAMRTYKTNGTFCITLQYTKTTDTPA